ncbi:UbiA family prenyltransferase [Pontibacter sp. SGAir0037]|uniref:UbiA family prenyltransferase n=1 Tax=Pontibacter sp. SGAir0037 TaxID=2571030 RepID=UPI001F0DD3B7|nr:UbiA family prenyltransferase [Pontibacter sp. SGAir0037]
MFQRYRAALVLMRIPFSVYLMPVYWFALSAAPVVSPASAILTFFILHLLVYPASNGYNSYFDKDEGSIGGLKQPPRVTPELLHVVLIFDTLAVLASLLLSPVFAAMVALYLLVSKAYSYKGIRLKKYPITSTIIVTVFQGAFTFIMVQVGAGVEPQNTLYFPTEGFALASTLLLCGSYPLTQIYQHEEDSKRGDKTLSLLLGIQGTFIFAASCLTLGSGVLLYLYFITDQAINILIFLVCTGPILYFFSSWVWQAQKNAQVVNYENTMRMNKISSICISLAFVTIMVVEAIRA